MQNRSSNKRFIFDASATAVAGHITRPYRDLIAVQAGSTLPSIGGLSSARSEGFRFKDILTIGAAYTEVIGSEPKTGVYETVAVSVVEDFNLLNVVTCKRIVARLSSRHPGKTEGSSESVIVPTGSHFEGLRIGNEYFDRLEVAPAYFCSPDRACWSGLQKAIRDQGEREMLLADSAAALDAKKSVEVLGFSLVKLDPKISLHIPQFGTVRLGEFFCYPSARHLVMLRAELGCPYEGELVSNEVIVDGSPFPP